MRSDDSEPQQLADDSSGVTLEKKTEQQTDTTDADAAQGRGTAALARLAAGARHMLAGLRHTVTTGHITDDEIRRRIVMRQLVAYEAVREQAREELDEVRKRLARLEVIGASDGHTPEQTQQARALRDERKRRDRALQALLKIEFRPAQPTRAQMRRARAVSSSRRVVGLVVVVGAAVALVVAVPELLWLAIPGALGALWWAGGRPPVLGQRPVPAALLARAELAPTPPEEAAALADVEELKPYPLAQAATGDEVAEALRRAIVHEGGDVASVTEVTKEGWGWSARVTFASGSPDDLMKDAAYKGIVTLLDIRRNGLLKEDDPHKGSACTVRLIERDPFTPELVGPVPYRPPLSMSIVDTANYGVAMDATPLEFSLAGVMLLMVADSGGGKSGVMLALAEVVTATRDAVALNIDPVGTGVGALGPAITLSACMDDKAICAVLKFLLDLCSARARQRARYGWGKTWRVSPEHPAFCLFVDEWPALSDTAKGLLVLLIMNGRKEGIWVYAGSQFGTKEHLGEAIGPKLSSKMLGACRRVDITELLGGGAVAEGYRADLLRPATYTARNDAGQIYAKGLPGMDDVPRRYQVREITDEYAAKVGAERAHAGFPNVEHTLAEAGLLDAWKALKAQCGDEGSRSAPGILTALREAFAVESDPEWLTVAHIHAHLKTINGEFWGQWDHREDCLQMVGRALKKALAEHDITLPTTRRTDQQGSKVTVYWLKDVTEAMARYS